MRNRDTRSVALVLTLDYGDSVAPLVKRMPVWIVSKINLAAVDRFCEGAKWVTWRPDIISFREGGCRPCLWRIIISLDEHYDSSSSASPYEG